MYVYDVTTISSPWTSRRRGTSATPEVIAQEIVEELGAAPAEFAAIAESHGRAGGGHAAT